MFNAYYLVEKDTGNLVSPFKYYEWTKPVVAARPFSATLVSAVVAEDLDGIFRGENDILITTRTSLGQQPLVERIHFFEKEIEKGQPITNLFSNSVFVSDDYNGNDRLYIELNIIEVDSDMGERKAATSAFQSLATTAGAVFPAIVPYALATSAAVGVVEKLMTALEKDKNVIKIPIALYPGRQRRGYTPLQEGTYVVFANPQNPEGIALGNSGLLQADKDISDLSYSVFDIYTEKRVSPAFVTSQKLATLLTQLRDGSKNSAKSSIAFVEETITGYSNFSKLERYMELKDKDSRSEEEDALMADIKGTEEIKPFIPEG
jgi:hypothetical protein